MTGPARRRVAIAAAVVLAPAAAGVLVGALTGGPAASHRGAITTTVAPASSTTVAPPTSTTVAPPSSTSTTPANAAALPGPTRQQFGANVNLLFNAPAVPAGLISTQLHALRAAGATVARSDALWEATEATAPAAGEHRYDWAFNDRVAEALAAAGLRWLPILDYSAPWAQSIPGQDHSPPRPAGAYAAYAGAFATRYGAGGAFWRDHPELAAKPVDTIEIWNEPDNGQFWTPMPDAAAYADLYAAARLAVHAADPGARVIVGGLTRPVEFVPAMLAARPRLAGHIDGVAVHPYGTPMVVAAKLEADRAMLVAAGLDGVPLYATEFGWTTSPPGALDYVPAATRPGYIRRTVDELGLLGCGVPEAVLYTWYSPRRDPADSQQWYGINASTPDTAAFTMGLRDTRTNTPRGRRC